MDITIDSNILFTPKWLIMESAINSTNVISINHVQTIVVNNKDTIILEEIIQIIIQISHKGNKTKVIIKMLVVQAT